MRVASSSAARRWAAADVWHCTDAGQRVNPVTRLDVADHLAEELEGVDGRRALAEERGEGLVHDRLVPLRKQAAVGLHQRLPDGQAVLASQGLDQVLEGRVATVVVWGGTRDGNAGVMVAER